MRALCMAVAVVGLLAGPSLGVIDIKIMAIDPITGEPSSAVTVTPGTQLTVGLYARGTVSGILSVGGDIISSGDTGVLNSSDQHFAWAAAYHTVQLWTPANNPTTQDGEIVKVFDKAGSFAPALPISTFTDVDNKPVAVSYTYPASPNAVVVAGQVAATQEEWNLGGVAGANGGMTQLGSSQEFCNWYLYGTEFYDRNFGKDDFVFLGSYPVTVTGTGTASLTWQEAPLVNGVHVGYGGFYTVGGDIGDWMVSTPAPAVIGSILPLTIAVPEPTTLTLLVLTSLLAIRRRKP